MWTFKSLVGEKEPPVPRYIRRGFSSSFSKRGFISPPQLLLLFPPEPLTPPQPQQREQQQQEEDDGPQKQKPPHATEETTRYDKGDGGRANEISPKSIDDPGGRRKMMGQEKVRQTEN